MILNWLYEKGLRKRIHTILRISFGSLICLILIISGCTMVGPDYVKPTAPEPEEWLEASDPQFDSEPTDFSQWWTVFNDPVLDKLINAAYEQNLPLQIAGLRIFEALAQLGIAVGFQYPQFQEAFGEATGNRISENAPNVRQADRKYLDLRIGLSAAWELDV